MSVTNVTPRPSPGATDCMRRSCRPAVWAVLSGHPLLIAAPADPAVHHEHHARRLELPDHLHRPAADPPTAFTVLSGPDLKSVTNVAAVVITGGNGVYEAIVPANGPRQFYRILRARRRRSPRSHTSRASRPKARTSRSPSPGARGPPTAFTVLSGPDVMSVTNVTPAIITGGTECTRRSCRPIPRGGSIDHPFDHSAGAGDADHPHCASGADYKITFTGPAADPPTAYAVLSSSEPTLVTNVTPASSPAATALPGDGGGQRPEAVLPHPAHGDAVITPSRKAGEALRTGGRLG